MTSLATSPTFTNAEDLRQRLGFDTEAMATYLGVSPRTYARRREKGLLDAAEILRLQMLEEVLREATRVFRDPSRARHWLSTPVASLDRRPPLAHLDSIIGYERVKETLAKIEYGTY